MVDWDNSLLYALWVNALQKISSKYESISKIIK